LVVKGFKATEWAQKVTEVVGGKNGGNESGAQGAGPEVEKVDAAILLATDFAAKMNF
jgi:alanyl-tRNA synthetase